MAYGGNVRFRTPGVAMVRPTVGVGVTIGVGYAADCDAADALAEAASVALVTSNPSGYL